MISDIVVVPLEYVIVPACKKLIEFSVWFYLTFLPFVLQYIAIPLFVLGIIIALAFAGGTVLFLITFVIFIFFFIKGTIFSSTP